mmetsp:Transcript_31983/g.65024  ORF Transcript_31983/g.65024 Transcript_31983/m.65024 type:complete len:83 (-) Transcript_31983:4318-4566(-)
MTIKATHSASSLGVTLNEDKRYDECIIAAIVFHRHFLGIVVSPKFNRFLITGKNTMKEKSIRLFPSPSQTCGNLFQPKCVRP